MSITPNMSMETHPDIVALRNSYDELGGGPALQVAEGLMVLAGLYAAASSWIVGFSGQTSLMMSNLICVSRWHCWPPGTRPRTGARTGSLSSHRFWGCG